MSELGRCDDPWELQEEQWRLVERQVADIELAARPPWSHRAAALGTLHCAGLLTAAGLLSLLRPRPVPDFCRELGRRYWFVAEMGIHKGVEISALARDSYRGRGVDLGCGDGIVGGILQRTCGMEPLVGVDVLGVQEPSVLAEGYAGFVESDLHALPLETDGFDYAVSVCVVEHLADLRTALGEVHRILRPGGTFHFTTPSPRFETSVLGYRFLQALGRREAAEAHRHRKKVEMLHYHLLSPEEWRRLLEECGFRDVRVRPIFSRFQHLVYDLMSLQINLMRLYFADRLRALGTRHEGLQRALAGATAVLSAQLALSPATEGDETHLHVTCTAGASGGSEST